MPVIQIDGPALADIDKKRTLVAEMTKAASEAYGLPRETFVVLIKENALDNVASGGVLISDKKE